MREPVEDEQIGEYRVPKGAQIFISPYVMHRRPEIFDNPTEFRPERFSRENERRIPRGAYIPFSVGPRVCQGKTFALMESRLILATLLRDFEPRLAPGFEPILYPKLSMSSANGMKVQVVRRPGR
jgi:cytochrome P450